jgi:aminobenzoyl-glutamate utilization protein B
MKRTAIGLIGTAATFGWLAAAPVSADVAPFVPSDRQVLVHLAKDSKAAVGLAQQVFAAAELGYQEQASSKALQAYLKRRKFKVTAGVAGIPTSFVATYGQGEPVIGILAEFDALPGLSQAPVPERQPVQADGPGHACGHHLFGAASASAGAAIAAWLRSSGTKGTIKVFGTPAEEGGSGKVYMAREGVFDGVAAMLHWHPGSSNSAAASSTTANKSGRFQFHGRAAHAASAPHLGRSALDGVEVMNYMVNMMREHVPMTSRLHYVITKGGQAPNIVPEFAEVYYYVRHPERDVAEELFERVVNAAKAAAQGTETRLEYEVMHGNYPVLPNEVLARRVDANMRSLQLLQYTPKETQFAQTLRETLTGKLMPLSSVGVVQPYKVGSTFGSTDVGDVSWQVPTVGFRTATWVPGTPAHSWQAVAAGGMSIGHKGMLLASQVLALTGSQLYLDDNLLSLAAQELQVARGEDFVYQALLGDRQPPLDYRN